MFNYDLIDAFTNTGAAKLGTAKGGALKDTLHLTLVSGDALLEMHVPPFSPAAPALIYPVRSQVAATHIQQVLLAVYSAEHQVELAHLQGDGKLVSEVLPLAEMANSSSFSAETLLYLPPLEAAASFEAFQEIVAHLRAPDGCPWDREQTHQSLRSNLLEETYETLAALDINDAQKMGEEFGDLLLQIVLHAQIASEASEFTMTDVLRHIYTKIVRRHPHVFGDVKVDGVGDVLQNWESIKAGERKANGNADASLLDGVPAALPALIQAEEIQKRAARVGFDWPDVQGVVEKILEEMQEIRAAGDATRGAEIGDLLFAVVNLARWYGVDAESVLREMNLRFRQRFGYIEKIARQQGRGLSEMSLQEMDELWDAAKRA